MNSTKVKRRKYIDKIWFHERKGCCCTELLPCENCNKREFSFNFLFSISKRAYSEAVLCDDCAALVFRKEKSVIVKFADLLILNDGMDAPNLVRVAVVTSLPIGSVLFDPFSNVLGYGKNDETIFSAALLDSDVVVDNTILAGRESWEGSQIGLQPDSDGLIVSDRDEDGFTYLSNVSKSVPLLKSGLDEERLLLQKRKFFPWKLTEEEKVKLGLIEKKLLR